MLAFTALGYVHAFPHHPGLWSSLTEAEGKKMCMSQGPSFPSSAPCSGAGAQSPHSSPCLPAHTTSWGRLSQRTLSPWEDRPQGNGWRAMRGKKPFRACSACASEGGCCWFQPCTLGAGKQPLRAAPLQGQTQWQHGALLASWPLFLAFVLTKEI